MCNKMKKLNNQEDEIKRIWQRCRLPEGAKKACPDTDILAAYVDHRLSGRESELLERHLLECPSCFDAVVLIRDVMERPEKEALSNEEMRRLFDLVPPGRNRGRQMLDALTGFLSSRLIPVPAFALSVFLICGLGFYAGMETRFDQDLYQEQISAELGFFFDNTASGLGLPGEEG